MKTNQHNVLKTGNNLLPVFLQEDISVLIVGGGDEALHYVDLLVQNGNAYIKVVSDSLIQKVMDANYENVQTVVKAYDPADLDDAHLVIIATADHVLADKIRNDGRQKRRLVYVPSDSSLSDFQFGEVAQKGNIKIAVSSTADNNLSLELKDTIQGYLHAGVESIEIENLGKISKGLASRFDNERNVDDSRLPFTELHWKRIASYSVLAFFFMILGHVLLSYVPLRELQATVANAAGSLDKTFLLMIVAGFTAQIIDGALGMGYGVTCTTFLLSLGINLPAISGSIHTAEMFSSAASGYSHYRFGNVNKKLFKALLIPGIIGAVAGAWLLSTLGKDYADIVRPVLALYTLILGLKIFANAFVKNKSVKKVKRVGWLAGAGGFLDSFGGGGWGPLVTSTLIAKGKTPKYVIGTVSVTEFFVTFASALTFFSLIGLSHWEVILGLIIGGVIAAPIAARLAGKLPVKTMFITVGVMVIIWSLRIIMKSFGVF